MQNKDAVLFLEKNSSQSPGTECSTTKRFLSTLTMNKQYTPSIATLHALAHK